jgi:hypothetical protein
VIQSDIISRRSVVLDKLIKSRRTNQKIIMDVVVLVLRSHITEVLCGKAHSHDKESPCLANCLVFFIECTTINIH